MSTVTDRRADALQAEVEILRDALKCLEYRVRDDVPELRDRIPKGSGLGAALRNAQQTLEVTNAYEDGPIT